MHNFPSAFTSEPSPTHKTEGKEKRPNRRLPWVRFRPTPTLGTKRDLTGAPHQRASTLTTFDQNVTLSSAAAGSQRPTFSARTPRKSMKKRRTLAWFRLAVAHHGGAVVWVGIELSVVSSTGIK
jgi:hypothetical protein